MKTFFLSMLVVTTISTNAQITKGNWMVGGTGNFYSSKSESISGTTMQEQKGIGINLTTNIGYFPVDKFAVGLVSSIGWGNPEGAGNSGVGFGIGPFTRYYFLNPENKINLFSHIEYQVQNGYRQGEKSTKTQNFNFKIGPAIYFNSSVALELTLEYAYGKVDSYTGIGSESKFNNFNIGVGFQIHLEK